MGDSVETACDGDVGGQIHRQLRVVDQGPGKQTRRAIIRPDPVRTDYALQGRSFGSGIGRHNADNREVLFQRNRLRKSDGTAPAIGHQPVRARVLRGLPPALHSANRHEYLSRITNRCNPVRKAGCEGLADPASSGRAGNLGAADAETGEFVAERRDSSGTMQDATGHRAVGKRGQRSLRVRFRKRIRNAMGTAEKANWSNCVDHQLCHNNASS